MDCLQQHPKFQSFLPTVHNGLNDWKQAERRSMTTNQIAFFNAKEQQRANLEREAQSRQFTSQQNEETARHNKATEAETQRANIARETETNRNNVAVLAETSRANLAREVETSRSNRANEDLKLQANLETNRANLARESYQWSQLAETSRSNRAHEGIETQKNVNQDWYNVAMAQASAVNAFAAQRNAETNAVNAETRLKELEHRISYDSTQSVVAMGQQSVREFLANYQANQLSAQAAQIYAQIEDLAFSRNIKTSSEARQWVGTLGKLITDFLDIANSNNNIRRYYDGY